LLHDVLEDVPGYYYEDLKKDFGAAVADIVRDLSEDKDPNVESDDKKPGKTARRHICRTWNTTARAL
jgi:(p)ppGpp synthase/HD superfamily hydrolase